jgi:hypothetical protein
MSHQKLYRDRVHTGSDTHSSASEGQCRQRDRIDEGSVMPDPECCNEKQRDGCLDPSNVHFKPSRRDPTLALKSHTCGREV